MVVLYKLSILYRGLLLPSPALSSQNTCYLPRGNDRNGPERLGDDGGPCADLQNRP